MKIAVLALDYDGTIAQGDTIDQSVRRAIAHARAAGIVVLIVTGRILDELRRVAGDLHFVDGVVAENGAVIHFPDSGHTSFLAPPIPAAFVKELQQRGVTYQVGRSLVDSHAGDGQRLLAAIQALEQPLVLLFNRSRVMTLPQGVSKATGLHTALDILRLSARNTLAIGDAENDHEMLRLAEVGVAVQWGSPALCAIADAVITGQGPKAVASYIHDLLPRGRLPVPAQARRRLLLGYMEDGRELSLAVRGRNVLVAGDAKSGKSWIAGLLCEQLILHGYCVCVIDPEGDYRALEGLPGVTVLGGEDPPPTPRDLLRALRYPDRSLVIDLSHVPQDDKIDYIRSVLPALNVMRRRTGLPHRIVLDEAHYFLHDEQASQLLDFEANGYIVATYCASRLPPALLAHTEVMIVTCESNPTEVEALCACCGGRGQVDHGRWRERLSRLTLGQAVALPITEEAGGELRMFTIARRLTPHVRHREKYVDVPVTEHRAFVFVAQNGVPARRIHTFREFVDALEHLPADTLDAYLRRGDFSRWVADVFGDHALADELQDLEMLYVYGLNRDTIADMVNVIRSRYDLSEDEVIETVVPAPSPATRVA